MTGQPAIEPDKLEGDATAKWPLKYRIRVPQQTTLHGSNRNSKKIWWSHELYRGPENTQVKILYCKTKEESEKVAQQFLEEPVIGFDMEWPWDSYKRHKLQEQVSLIQLACEDRIALFHIGAHKGKTTDELIAPTLKRIIENPAIAKCGVAVLNADFARLSKHFKIKPRGAFEISHLHRLVTFGSWKPEEVTTKLVALKHIVERQLGLPLSKGSVRTSDWSKELNRKQKEYAAADAYAGFMAFHRMNAKRVAMKPVPPSPALADSYLPMKMPSIMSLRLGVEDAEGNILTAEDFYSIALKDTSEGTEDTKAEANPNVIQTEGTEGSVTDVKTDQPKARKRTEGLDSLSKEIYLQLVQRRRDLATAESVFPYRIATNSVLECIATQRPTDEAELLKVKGVGKVQLKKYGSHWLEVVKLASKLSKASTATADSKAGPEGLASNQITRAEFEDMRSLHCPTTPNGRRRPKNMATPNGATDSTSSSSAFGSPPQRTPQLHTGLSFTLAQTSLDPLAAAAMEMEESSDEDPETFATPLSRPDTERKRKRTESPCKGRTPTLIHPMHTAPLTPRSRIFRSKLLAFSRRVTTKLDPVPAEPIVSDRTLDQIVASVPRTPEELGRIPNIDRFLSACIQAEMDLLKNIIKFAPPPHEAA